MTKCIMPTSSDILAPITHTKSNVPQRRNTCNNTEIRKEKIVEKNTNFSSEMGRACIIGLYPGSAEIKVSFSTVF